MSVRLTYTTVVVLSVACLSTFTIYAGAGGKGGGAGKDLFEGPFKFILDHSTEIGLTADQTKQIQALKQKFEAQFASLRQDSDLRQIMQQIRAARQSNNEDKIPSLREQMRTEIVKKTGLSKETVIADVSKILNKDQLAKLQALHMAGGGKEGGMRAKGMAGKNSAPVDDAAKPDPTKGPPPVFDTDNKKAPATQF